MLLLLSLLVTTVVACNCPTPAPLCFENYCAANGTCLQRRVCTCGDGILESPYEECDDPLDSFCSSECRVYGTCVVGSLCYSWMLREDCIPDVFTARTHCSQTYACCESGECSPQHPADCVFFNGTFSSERNCTPETCLIGACCSERLIGSEFQRCHRVYTPGECKDLDGYLNLESIDCPSACASPPGACIDDTSSCTEVSAEEDCDGEWHLLEHCPTERFCNTNLMLFLHHLCFIAIIALVTAVLFFFADIVDKVKLE